MKIDTYVLAICLTLAISFSMFLIGAFGLEVFALFGGAVVTYALIAGVLYLVMRRIGSLLIP